MFRELCIVFIFVVTLIMVSKCYLPLIVNGDKTDSIIGCIGLIGSLTGIVACIIHWLNLLVELVNGTV